MMKDVVQLVRNLNDPLPAEVDHFDVITSFSTTTIPPPAGRSGADEQRLLQH